MGVSFSSRAGLVALSAACFISVTSENLPVALNAQLSADLDVSRSAIGLLVSGYAAVVAVTAVPLIATTARFDRRQVAVATIGTVAVANLIVAIAPNYPTAALGRVIAALGHGVFWSVVASMAARLAGPGDAGRATATVFVGNSLAMVIGLPLSSAIGSMVGWRAAVALLAFVAAVSGLAIRLLISPMPSHMDDRAAGRASDPSAVSSNRPLYAVIAATLFLVLGHFTTWTYVTLLLTRYVHVSGSGIAAVLFANGIVGLAGLLVVRRHIDQRPRAVNVIVSGGVAVCMATLLIASDSPWLAGVAIVSWAVPAGAIAVALQAAVLRAAPRQQDIASAAYVVAYQIGIAAGAAIGGWFVERASLAGAVATAAVFAVIALAIVLTARKAFPIGTKRKSQRSSTTAEGA